MGSVAQEIEKLAASANYLTDTEKELLAEVAPHFPTAQLAQLLQILQVGKPVPRPVAMPQQQSNIEVQTLDLPELPTPQTKAKPSGSNLQGLLKQMKQETVEFSTKPMPRPAPMPKPAPRPMPRQVPTPAPMPAPAPIRPQIKYKPIGQIASSEELAQVSMGQLRQGDFRANLEAVKAKIGEIAMREKTLAFMVVKSFDMSPASRLFMRTGLALMDDIDQNREAAFARIKQKLEQDSGDSFTPMEFEEFSSFKRELEDIMY